jgi:hypothetical protein
LRIHRFSIIREQIMKASTKLIFVALSCASAGGSIAAEPAGRTADRQSTVLLAQANTAAVAVKRPAKFDSDRPGEHGAVIAARQGPAALRHYIERTQGIFALRYGDYLQP